MKENENTVCMSAQTGTVLPPKMQILLHNQLAGFNSVNCAQNIRYSKRRNVPLIFILDILAVVEKWR